MIEESHIKNQFLVNPVWKELFLRNFPDWKPETYISSAKILFERNGYRFIEEELREMWNGRRKYLEEVLQKVKIFAVDYSTFESIELFL